MTSYFKNRITAALVTAMKIVLSKVQIKLLLTVFVIVFALSGMLVTGVIRIESLWFIFPFMAIRISTVITAIVGFVLVLFLQQKTTYKAFYYALLTVIFSMSLYEVVWYYIAVGFRGYELRFFEFAALFGWVVLGVREVISKRPSRLSSVFYGIFLISMLLWVGSGFNFNNLGDSSFSISGEILNIVSKTALTFGYALHISVRS